MILIQLYFLMHNSGHVESQILGIDSKHFAHIPCLQSDLSNTTASDL